MTADSTGTDSDGVLLGRLQAGEEAAFNELVQRHQESLVRFVSRLVGDADEAGDVVQETFIRAYERVGEFRGGSSLYTWLYRIAHNLAISLLRKRNVRRFLRLDGASYNAGGSGDEAGRLPLELVSTDDPGQNMERAEALQVIEAAIVHLPPRQRGIFVMRHYEGMTHAEIAQVVGRSEGAIRAGYFHAVRKVRDAARAAGLLETS